MTRKIQRWSEEEKLLLKEVCNDEKEEIMNHFPTRTWKSVVHMINRMKLPREKQWIKFTEDEDNILRENYMLTKEELNSLLPHRSWDSIIQRCTKLELDRPKAWNLWTKEEEDILSKCHSYEEAESKLTRRNRIMIVDKASSMGLISQLTKHWQKWEDEYLLNNYESIVNVKDMLDVLNKRNLQGIYNRANDLGLNRRNDDKSISDEEIINLHEKGMYMSQIARELDITPHTVKKRLLDNGIVPESKILYGEESPQWKGGITNENVLLRSRVEYREWRNKVYERDNYTCQRCGDKKGGNLHAHHIKNFSSHEELRYEVSNGITLCATCHNYGPDSFHMKYGTCNNTPEQLKEHINSYEAVEEM